MKPNKTAEEVLKMARIGLRDWCFAAHAEGYVTLGVYVEDYKIIEATHIRCLDDLNFECNSGWHYVAKVGNAAKCQCINCTAGLFGEAFWDKVKRDELSFIDGKLKEIFDNLEGEK